MSLQCCLPNWTGCTPSLGQGATSKPTPNISNYSPLPVLSKNKLCQIQPSLSEGSLGPEGAGSSPWVGLIPLAPSLLPAPTRAAFREKGAGSKAQPRACSGGVVPCLRLKLRLILECHFCCASAETGFTEESVQWCNYRLQLPKLPNWPCAHFYSFKGL